MTSIPQSASAAAPAGWSARIRVALLNRDVQRLLVNIALVLLIGLAAHVFSDGKFYSVRNLNALVVQISVVTIIASAMTLVMVAGAIDISVPGIVVLSGVIGGILIVHGVPMWLAFFLATLAGGVVGLVNSYLVIGIGITSLIATIGSLYVTQGMANLLTNGLPVVGLPRTFSVIGTGFIGPVPIPLPIMLGVVALLVALQRLTRLGRHIVATGSNPQAAFLNGIKVKRTLTTCFVISGLAAGWGGVMYASRIGNPTPVVDNDLLFQVIVAIVIGGTSLNGGQGSVLGTFVGAVLIGVVNQTLNLLGVSTFWQYIALGVLLVLSVGSDQIMRGNGMRDLRRRLVGSLTRRPGNCRRMTTRFAGRELHKEDNMTSRKLRGSAPGTKEKLAVAAAFMAMTFATGVLADDMKVDPSIPDGSLKGKKVLVSPYWLDAFGTANSSWITRMLEPYGVQVDAVNPERHRLQATGRAFDGDRQPYLRRHRVAAGRLADRAGNIKRIQDRRSRRSFSSRRRVWAD